MAGAGYGTKGGSVPATKGSRAAEPVVGARAMAATRGGTIQMRTRDGMQEIPAITRMGDFALNHPGGKPGSGIGLMVTHIPSGVAIARAEPGTGPRQLGEKLLRRLNDPAVKADIAVAMSETASGRDHVAARDRVQKLIEDAKGEHKAEASAKSEAQRAKAAPARAERQAARAEKKAAAKQAKAEAKAQQKAAKADARAQKQAAAKTARAEKEKAARGAETARKKADPQAYAEEQALAKLRPWTGFTPPGTTLATVRAKAGEERGKAREAIRELRAARADDAAAKKANEGPWRAMMDARGRGSYGSRHEAEVAVTNQRMRETAARVKAAEQTLQQSRANSRMETRDLKEATAALPAPQRAVALAARAQAAAARPGLQSTIVRPVTPSAPAPGRAPGVNPRTAKVKLEKGGTISSMRRDETAKEGMSLKPIPKLAGVGGYGITKEGGGVNLIGKTGYAMTTMPSRAAGEAFLKGSASGKTLGRAEGDGKGRGLANKAIMRYRDMIAAREAAKAAGSSTLVSAGRVGSSERAPRVPSIASGGGLHVIRQQDLPINFGKKSYGHAIIEGRTGRVLAKDLSRAAATSVVGEARTGKTTARLAEPTLGRARTPRVKRAEKALERLVRIREKQAERSSRAAA